MPKKLFKKFLTGLLCMAMMTALSFNISCPVRGNAEDVSELSPTQETYDFIFQLEGCDLQCFWDVSQWTVGYGTRCPYEHNLRGTHIGQKGGHTIDKDEAMEIFKQEFPQYIKILNSNCAGLSMNQHQYDALLSAVYNHGNVRTCPLKSYLMGELTEEQARQKYYVWCINAGTSTEAGLRNRRKAEADLFFTPCEPEQAPVPEWTSISAPNQTFKAGNEITFTLLSDTGSNYSVQIQDEDGNLIQSYELDTVNDSTLAYCTHEFQKAGVYFCSVTAHNLSGSTEGETISVTVENDSGNVNKDNIVNIVDAVILKKYLMNQITLTEEQFDAGDVNQDGKVNIYDYLLLKKMIM